ncbi:aminomethyl-transferring glycine dehydrogenase, partial [Frankia sp. CiP1_Cm_nod2]|uniref:aminomethyl-transferring glycine dehydrogenase n=1 Tax=Frankia sp. CiP1_Cm_nod2 TaxID=2897161 RepID=UPI00404404A2
MRTSQPERAPRPTRTQPWRAEPTPAAAARRAGPPLTETLTFADRHIGPDADERRKMLDGLGHASLDALVAAAVPEVIRDSTLDLPPAASEPEVLAELRRLGSRNRPVPSMIGLGYHPAVLPGVIQRNVLENPAWYTAYTPYQPEISQGRLEALLNFQTMIADLTGLATAGASLLDESTAAAEAMQLARRAAKKPETRFVVDVGTLPQTIAVLRTRARALGIEVVVMDLSAGIPEHLAESAFGVLLAYPAADGALRDPRPVIEQARGRGIIVAVAVDPLALTLLAAPGEFGADIAVGSAQRFGLGLGFGGPHAGFIAVRAGLERSLPGRLVGVSVDADGEPAYRLALQTREQHIRREKATSNICTAQVLPAVLTSMYAVYHGPRGLAGIAGRVHGHAVRLAAGLRAGGVRVVHEHFFDTVLAQVPSRAAEVVAAALAGGLNLRLVDADHVGISCNETTLDADLHAVWAAFGVPPLPSPSVVALPVRNATAVGAATASAQGAADGAGRAIPAELVRASPYLEHPVFHRYRSETAMLRYLRHLADKDLALDRGMIPLGSCTMKLNATTEMAAVTWPDFADIHPFAPLDQAAGYLELIRDLEKWLVAITGYAAVSLQPNAGSQGELAGLLAIRAYHRDHAVAGRPARDVCLIPSSAHGTNAASAVMAGMRVVVVACDSDGNVDLEDLAAKASAYSDRLAALMVTYPSTHGVYEEGIGRACDLVHSCGGLVYVDGANLNALVGL